MKRILGGIAIALLIIVALGFLLLPGILESNINRVVDHEPYEVPEAAQAMHEGLSVVDLHADTLLWARDPLERGSRGHVDIPRLAEGNVTLQVFSAVTKVPYDQQYEGTSGDSDIITLLATVQRWPARTWDSLLERALYQAQKLKDAESRAPEKLMVVRSAADIDRLIERRGGGAFPVGGLLAIEGAHPLEGKIKNIGTLYDAGYRMMGITHFFDNELGGSLHGLSGDGLTDFGREAVREMERRKIIIDLAHASPAVVRDTLDMVKRPVVVSHTGLYGACESPRNLEDPLMKRIAEAGGLVGIGYWEGAACGTSPADIVRSIRFAVDFLGIDHVALGSDYDGAVPVAFDTSELAVLTAEMLNAGFTEEEISKVMGGNAIHFFRENLPQR